MKSPIVRLAAIATLVIALTAGCAPDPGPTPSPTGFASEEQAFAAAEKTYRAYVDALNQVNLSDPQTFEAVYQWTTGELNASDRKGLSEYHASGSAVSGSSVIVSLAFISVSENFDTVQLASCLDVSSVDVRDAAGNSLVDGNRADVQSLEVTAEKSPTSRTGLVISTISGRDGGPACGA